MLYHLWHTGCAKWHYSDAHDHNSYAVYVSWKDLCITSLQPWYQNDPAQQNMQLFKGTSPCDGIWAWHLQLRLSGTPPPRLWPSDWLGWMSKCLFNCSKYVDSTLLFAFICLPLLSATKQHFCWAHWFAANMHLLLKAYMHMKQWKRKRVRQLAMSVSGHTQHLWQGQKNMIILLDRLVVQSHQGVNALKTCKHPRGTRPHKFHSNVVKSTW